MVSAIPLVLLGSVDKPLSVNARFQGMKKIFKKRKKKVLDSRLCVISSNIGVYMKNRGKRITDMRNELIEGVTFSAGKKTHKKKTNTFHSQHMCKITMPH